MVLLDTCHVVVLADAMMLLCNRPIWKTLIALLGAAESKRATFREMRRRISQAIYRESHGLVQLFFIVAVKLRRSLQIGTSMRRDAARFRPNSRWHTYCAAAWSRQSYFVSSLELFLIRQCYGNLGRVQRRQLVAVYSCVILDEWREES